ncbi:hypothetical protein BDN72DRAFT_837858 [Pluteus cervinus]|uniref:Uncharacterized protein n=1 Tax=Pluteus cervinus TaxID=181527 RepID=A0ACD3AZT2_9AGAR|nr:hypothetical protein BDN72DRAFT_837858 [Pluteus cervinus]
MFPMAGLDDLNEDVLLHIVSFHDKWEFWDKIPFVLSRTSKPLREIFFARVWRDCTWSTWDYCSKKLKLLPDHVTPWIKHLTVRWPVNINEQDRDTYELPIGGVTQLWPILAQFQNVTTLTMLFMDMKYWAALSSTCTSLPSLISLTIKPLTIWPNKTRPLTRPTGIANLKEFRVLLPAGSPSRWAQSARREAASAADEGAVISSLIMPSIPTLELLELDGEHLPYLRINATAQCSKLRHIKLCNLQPVLADGAVLLDYFPDAPLLEELELFLHRLQGESPISLASRMERPDQLFPFLHTIKLYNPGTSDRFLRSLPANLTHLELTSSPFPVIRPFDRHAGRGAPTPYYAPGIQATRYTTPETIAYLQGQIYPNLLVLKLALRHTEEGPLTKEFANILVEACPQMATLLIHTSCPSRSNASVLVGDFASGLERCTTLKFLYAMVEWAEFENFSLSDDESDGSWRKFFMNHARLIAQKLPGLREVAFLEVRTARSGYFLYSTANGEIEKLKTGTLNLVQPFANTSNWKSDPSDWWYDPNS